MYANAGVNFQNTALYFASQHAATGWDGSNEWLIFLCGFPNIELTNIRDITLRPVHPRAYYY